ncbi:uncharacterized protein G2W53_000967 [Senna tora]|uniref:Uncharacterized protein n=1 Tax=Senna tora TaxID=362788 RepID=A0A834XFA7_9FABA|nr:uncharacterized protein G2W53_000967 [Senna tora]
MKCAALFTVSRRGEGMSTTRRAYKPGPKMANATSGTDLGRSHMEVTNGQGLRIPRLKVES